MAEHSDEADSADRLPATQQTGSAAIGPRARSVSLPADMQSRQLAADNQVLESPTPAELHSVDVGGAVGHNRPASPPADGPGHAPAPTQSAIARWADAFFALTPERPLPPHPSRQLAPGPRALMVTPPADVPLTAAQQRAILRAVVEQGPAPCRSYRGLLLDINSSMIPVQECTRPMRGPFGEQKAMAAATAAAVAAASGPAAAAGPGTSPNTTSAPAGSGLRGWLARSRRHSLPPGAGLPGALLSTDAAGGAAGGDGSHQGPPALDSAPGPGGLPPSKDSLAAAIPPSPGAFPSLYFPHSGVGSTPGRASPRALPPGATATTAPGPGDPSPGVFSWTKRMSNSANQRAAGLADGPEGAGNLAPPAAPSPEKRQTLLSILIPGSPSAGGHAPGGDCFLEEKISPLQQPGRSALTAATAGDGPHMQMTRLFESQPSPIYNQNAGSAGPIGRLLQLGTDYLRDVRQERIRTVVQQRFGPPPTVGESPGAQGPGGGSSPTLAASLVAGHEPGSPMSPSREQHTLHESLSTLYQHNRPLDLTMWRGWLDIEAMPAILSPGSPTGRRGSFASADDPSSPEPSPRSPRR
ncbi:hypothetical protein H696_03828 [Fonticula alba]|uniref:Uncharacterized protein n=1 Tax=Fonticula alba TaxID=691883 RepID=A0A058Z798_FONAL|nr:hypothetical protein H696_03828 [Fonticula alba]KCV69397.1 hypothetical protein H696_03828 [Fonticula alba]|eukprot:XP_009495962.1 hypothetical protein H696_03828 [Fonticula alba]